MKKSKKALALGVTLLALGATACAAKDTKSVQSTAATTESAASAGESTAAESKQAEAEDDKQAAAPEQLRVSIESIRSTRERESGGETGIGSQDRFYEYPNWAMLPTLPDGATAALTEALDAYADTQQKALEAYAAAHQNSAEDDSLLNRYAGDVRLTRSDSNYLSFVRGTDSYSADAEGYTYDSKTGERVLLTQIVRDEKQFDSAVDQVTQEIGMTELAALAKEGFPANKLIWALGNEGLELYLPKSDGNYVMYIRVVLSYESFPELFADRVKARPAQYAAVLGPNQQAYIDGKRIHVSAPSGQSGSFTVEVDNKEYKFKKSEESGDLLSLVFVKTTEGDYLYCEFVGDIADDSQLVAVNMADMSENTELGTPDLCTGFDLQRVTDPATLFLNARLDTLSTLTASLPVSVGQGGKLEAQGSYQYLGVTELHTKQALTLSLVKNGKESGETVELPADTKLFFYAGDGKSYVDFRLEDDRVVRVHIASDENGPDGSLWKVEGKYYDKDVFSGMRYAG